MLAVSVLRDTNTITKDHHEEQGGGDDHQMERSFSINPEEFPEFADHGNLLESIDFDDLFDGIDVTNDILPDLEMDPADILGDFSISGGEESDVNYTSALSIEEEKVSYEDSTNTKISSGKSGDEIVSSKINEEEEAVVVKTVNGKDGEKGRKSSAQGKHSSKNQGKRKVKVDWTPELHRRFVQAVEQLGVDKAVPSRILELMGIDCLTRHNIASHLQKYRSHRKHLLAREAEAASWSQRRQLYSASAVAGGGGKRDMNPWIAPTIGFPPVTVPMHHHHPHHFRPLHVWGHPTVDQTLMHMWPKHLPAHSPSPPPLPHPPIWAPPPPPLPPDPLYWHNHHHQRVVNPNGLTPGTPCFPQPLAPTRFVVPPVPGIPPHHAMCKADPGIGDPAGQSGPPLVDLHPSKESIDAALGDVLSKPWLPLPLGLKPPGLDSVLVELQRQGVSKIPPTCA